MKIEDLEAIAIKNNFKVEDCFTDCITNWLRQNNPRPTWMTIIEALRSPTVGFLEVAERPRKNGICHLPDNN